VTIPTTYREQGGCHNCRHCFIMFEYDCGPSYFCTLGGVHRPPCGSVAMGEFDMPATYGDDYEAWESATNARYEAWSQWAIHREVAAFGICDNWERADRLESLGANQ
jgi:hypothetical protein